jgi:hypothetical protein
MRRKGSGDDGDGGDGDMVVLCWDVVCRSTVSRKRFILSRRVALLFTIRAEIDDDTCPSSISCPPD